MTQPFNIPKRKAIRTKTAHDRQHEKLAHANSCPSVVHSILAGEKKPKQVSQAFKERKMPLSDVKQVIKEHQVLYNKWTEEIKTVITQKAMGMIASIEPHMVHPNARALAAAILIDKAMKIHDATPKTETTLEDRLLEFVSQHGITFQDLITATQSGQCPDSLPPELFQKLKEIVLPSTPQTLDLDESK